MSVTTQVSRDNGSAFVVTLRDSGHQDLDVVFTYDEVEDGWRLVSLRVGLLEPATDGPGLRASSLRDLPLVRWQRAARAALIESARKDLVGWFEDQDVAARALGIEKLRLGQIYRDPKLALRLNQMKRLAYVARLYQRCLAEGRPDPAAAVGRELELKPSTARSLIYRARKAGLLELSRPKAADALARSRK